MGHVADMYEASSSTRDHVELLATKWWTAEEFRQYGVHSRVHLQLR
jgi:hypothetical protein